MGRKAATGIGLGLAARVAAAAPIAAATLVAACNPLDDTTPGDGQTCPPSGCAAGTVTGVVRGPDGALTGTWTSPAGSGTVAFTVKPSGTDGAVATFGTGVAALTATLSGPASGSLAIDGGTVDGDGTPSPDEAAALDALVADADLAASLVAVPLEMGCSATPVTDAEMAALVLPWQVLLKYRTADRVAAIRAAADGSSCLYFDEVSVKPTTRPAATWMLLSFEHPIPGVFGQFPLDEAGARDGGAGSVSGAVIAPTGPCGAKCRGACGADCNRNNCKRTMDGECVEVGGSKTGEWKAVWHEDCGVHPACIEHDDCYDQCNVQFACGRQWGHFGCMRECDYAGVAKWGFSDSKNQVRGYGPFSERVTFDFEETREDLDTCPPDDPPKPGTYGGVIWLGTGPAGEPGTLGLGLFRVDPDAGRYDLVAPRPIYGVAVSPSGKLLAAGYLNLNDLPPYLALFDISDGSAEPMEGVHALDPTQPGSDQLTSPTFVTEDLIVVSDVGMLRMWDRKKKLGSKKIWDGWHASAAWGTTSVVVETGDGFKGILDVNKSAYSDYDPWDLDPTHIQFQNVDPAKLWTVKGGESDWAKPKFSPDGGRIAFIDGSDPSAVHDARITVSGDVTDHLTYTGPGAGAKVAAVAWSPDGKHVAFVVAGAKSAGGGVWIAEQGKPGTPAARVLAGDVLSNWHADLAWSP